MTDRDQRVKQTERNLAAAKTKNTGVRPPGKPDRPTSDRQPPNPGQSIVNSDQNSG